MANIPSLAKVTYVWGNRDEAVGPLSSTEVDFLISKGAAVALVPGGDHQDGALEVILMMKEKFGIN